MSEKDHEFPWIEREDMTLRCTICNETGDIDDWIEFINKHSGCQEKLNV